MKKHLVLIVLLFMSFSIVYSQNQFENPGFEEWEPDDSNDPKFEPVDWSSIKTGDLGAVSASPRVMFRSDDAHTGNHSAYLINVYTGIIDKVATGTITNGRIHVDPGLDPAKSSSFTDVNDSRWNTPLTKKPDSVVGWYKANPVPGDFPTVKVILHADSNSIPGDSLKWIARAYWKGDEGVEVNQWTRFSAPFDYYLTDTPEFMLSILTSGNGLSALEDSEAWFDDMKLIYNGTDIPENQTIELSAYYSKGEIIFTLEEPNVKNAIISLTDINGRQVYQGAFEVSNQNRIRFNLSNGIYILSLKTSEAQYAQKLVVQ